MSDECPSCLGSGPARDNPCGCIRPGAFRHTPPPDPWVPILKDGRVPHHSHQIDAGVCTVCGTSVRWSGIEGRCRAQKQPLVRIPSEDAREEMKEEINRFIDGWDEDEDPASLDEWFAHMFEWRRS